MAPTERINILGDDIDIRRSFERELTFLDHNDTGGRRSLITGKTLGEMRKSLLGQRKPESEAEEELSSSADSSDHSSDSAASSDSEKKKSKKAKAGKRKRSSKKTNESAAEQLATILAAAALKPRSAPVDSVQVVSDPLALPGSSTVPAPALSATDIAQQVVQLLKQQDDQVDKKGKAPGKTGSKAAFKRVDQVYDRKIHNYKLKETVHDDPQRDEWDQVCSVLELAVEQELTMLVRFQCETAVRC